VGREVKAYMSGDANASHEYILDNVVSIG
jgi:hypothetical protein